MLKAIHAQEHCAAARQNAEQMAVKLKEMKLADAAELLCPGIVTAPVLTRKQIVVQRLFERLLRDVRRRTRAVGSIPGGKSALMLAAAAASCGRHEVGHTA